MRRHRPRGPIDAATVMRHVLRIDRHLPFTTPAARRLIEVVRSAFLAREYTQTSLDGSDQIRTRQAALGRGGM